MYRGKVGLDVAEAQHLMEGLDWQGAVKDIQASVNWLKATGSPKVLKLPAHVLWIDVCNLVDDNFASYISMFHLNSFCCCLISFLSISCNLVDDKVINMFFGSLQSIGRMACTIHERCKGSRFFFSLMD